MRAAGAAASLSGSDVNTAGLLAFILMLGRQFGRILSTLFHGDPLLQADRRLGYVLDGVYRPAEFYLRWMQRLSSLGFGTAVGRFVTLYFTVPFGGAFLIYKFFFEILEFIHHHGFFSIKHIHYYENASSDLIWLWGFLFLGLINFPTFRKGVGRAFVFAFLLVEKWIFLPFWRLLHSRIVQLILHSRPYRYFVRFVVKPAVWTFLAWLLLPLKGETGANPSDSRPSRLSP